jgi:hypothetical protein
MPLDDTRARTLAPPDPFLEAPRRRRTRGHNPASFPVLRNQVRTATGMFYAPGGRNLCRNWPWLAGAAVHIEGDVGAAPERTPAEALLDLLRQFVGQSALLPDDKLLAAQLHLSTSELRAVIRDLVDRAMIRTSTGMSDCRPTRVVWLMDGPEAEPPMLRTAGARSWTRNKPR